MNRLFNMLTEMLAIVLVAAILGVGLEPRFPGVAQPTSTPRPENKAQAASVSLAEVKEKLNTGDNMVLLDARTLEEYQAGHIKGAISLPLIEFTERYAQIEGQLSKDSELVVYCNGSSCGLSTAVAEALLAKGYGRVRVFFGGWPEWLAAGYPIEHGGSG